MPVLNGDASHSTAEPSLYLTPSKRKHASTTTQGSESSDPTGDTDGITADSLILSLKDILDAALQYDSELKLLQYPLPMKSNLEPDNKRAKLSEPDARASIESKVNAGEYKSLQEFTDDVERAATLIVSEAEQPRGRPEHLKTLNTNELSNHVNLVKGQLNDLLLRSRRLQSLLVIPAPTQDQEDLSQSNPLSLPAQKDHAILTITTGNPPRTYFSSFQRTETGNILFLTGRNISDRHMLPPLDAIALPGDIRISKVIPHNATRLQNESGTTRTFGEVFQPPTHLPQLKRPQRSKPLTTDRVVGWLKPVDILAASSTTLSGQKLYNNKPLRPGLWLDYGRNGSHLKSAAGPAVASNDNEKSDALFRSAYSSFAPAHDSGGAVIHETTKHLAYWDKRGRDRFNQLFPDWNMDETEPVRQLFEKTALEPEPLNDADLRLAIESYDTDVNMEDLEKSQKANTENPTDKEIEHILEEISELLRTLHSYRHLRNLYPPPGQISKSDSSVLNQLSDTPSEEEKATYGILKQSLASMISLLPPFAVAKLDGDQLANLNINMSIKQDGLDYAGTMEEDEWTIRQKQASRVPQAVSRSPAPSAHSPRVSGYQTSQHPNIAPHQRYQSTRTRNSSTGYQSPQGSVARQQPPATQYQPAHPAHAFTQPSQSSQRYVQPQYTQPTPAPQYTRTGMLQQFQRPSQSSPNAYAGQRGLSPSQTPQQQQYPRPAPQTNYQPRPSATSPHRPANLVQAPQRQPYVNSPSVGTQPRYFQQQNQSSTQYPNFPSNQASPVPTQFSSSSAAMTYSRSATEQAALLERNRTPLLEAQRRISGLNQPSQMVSHQIPPHNSRGNTPNNPPRQQLTPKP
ncbi:hypothetical protein PRK78_000581 [Emydomyces testavorans]|uniref:Uncharacterized protein n=1 Tax=Emydomyces testavorans TaxID=2070801 RepID=A0AAF0IG18_9EURO|nr:hypothetical protein PRK78_000581 [Emydomyces testavorans]